MKPDIRYTDKCFGGYLPSWSGTKGEFLNDEHSQIYAKTEHLEGWQAKGDSYKLFEMGYHCGDVILEIGVFGARSASVELLGALSNPHRLSPPQYYGIDIDERAIVRSTRNLKAQGLDKHALLYLGDIESFTDQVDITPTMVFLDGDHSYNGVKSDLTVLSEILVEGTPILCHDFRGPPEHRDAPLIVENPHEVTDKNMWISVQKACFEWEEAGYAEFLGSFGCSGLFLTTSKCSGNKEGLRSKRFDLYRDHLQNAYRNNLSDVTP